MAKQNKNTIELVYVGRRINGNALRHAYIEKEKIGEYFDGGLLLFKAQLSYERIGDSVVCERTETGVRGIDGKGYEVKRDVAKEERVKQWSTEDLAAKLRNAERLRSKTAPSGSVEDLINAVKESTFGKDRKRIALYIYDKLTS